MQYNLTKLRGRSDIPPTVATRPPIVGAHPQIHAGIARHSRLQYTSIISSPVKMAKLYPPSPQEVEIDYHDAHDRRQEDGERAQYNDKSRCSLTSCHGWYTQTATKVRMAHLRMSR
jgi:hypothetical protein